MRWRRKEAPMKPILFNTYMVRAILDGRKTVTRRVVKFKPGQNPQWTGYIPDGPVLYGSNNIPASKSPYHTGDILYVRETWNKVKLASESDWHYEYRARCKNPAYFSNGFMAEWRPSIHMPKEAARLFLRVTDVRVERLQAITPEQIDAEGCKEWAYSAKTGELLPSSPSFFRIKWDRTIKPSDLPIFGWAANPWVWVIEFERVSKEEALKGGEGQCQNTRKSG